MELVPDVEVGLQKYLVVIVKSLQVIRVLGLLRTLSLVFLIYLIMPEPAGSAEESPSNEQSLLEILKNKGVITEEDYKKLKDEKNEQKPEISAGYDRGFYIQSPDGEHQLKFNGLTRVQFTLFPPDTPESNTQIQARTVALVFRGFIFRDFEFRTILVPTDADPLFDAYADIHFKPWLNLRLGQFRIPFSREQLVFVNGVDTIERSIIGEAISPLWDMGVMLHGTPQHSSWNYGLGIFNGSGRNTFDGNDKLDLAGRIVFEPFLSKTDSIWKALNLGANFQIGDQPFNINGGRVRFLTRSDRAVLFNSPTQGFRQRYGFDLRYEWESFTLQGEIFYEQQQREEVVTATGELATTPEEGIEDASDLERLGGYLELGYLLRGDRNQGLQVVAKYEWFQADDLGNGELGNVPSQTLDAYILGLNWYIRRTIKLQVNGILEDLKRSVTAYGQPDRGNFLDGSPNFLLLSQFQLLF